MTAAEYQAGQRVYVPAIEHEVAGRAVRDGGDYGTVLGTTRVDGGRRWGYRIRLEQSGRQVIREHGECWAATMSGRVALRLVVNNDTEATG